MSKVKVVFISDTHNMLEKIEIPDGDILIHAGDATMGGSPDEVIQFNTDLKKLTHPFKIVVPGNHDRLFERDPGYAKQLMSSATVLIDEEITIKGLRIYGSPWTPAFGRGWAFQLETKEQSEKIWAGIKKGLDILVTHGPPHGILDGVPYAERSTTAWLNNMEYTPPTVKFRYVGCPFLRDQVVETKPKIHVFGHIHEAHGTAEIGGIKYLNAAICDGDYELTNKPHVVEMEVPE